MMDSLILAGVYALWLGILTSISPCPLATNIAAISFIGHNLKNTRLVIVSGVLYAVGRTVVYVGIGVLLVSSLLSSPAISNFLQKYMNKFLGPLLIIIGMILLEMIQFNLSTMSPGQRMQKRIGEMGLWGAGILGILFALAFCPVSAALFFGNLIPLAIEQNSRILLPLVYGIGTAVPVFVFAVLVAVSTQYVGKVFNNLVRFEWWARRITGILFILIGIYLSLRYIFLPALTL